MDKLTVHFKKAASILLSGIILFNVTGAGFAQAINLKKLEEEQGLKIKNALNTEYYKAVSESTRVNSAREKIERQLETTMQAEKDFLKANPEVLEARGIQGKIIGDGPSSTANAEKEESSVLSKQDFKEEYNKAVAAELDRALKSIEKYKNNSESEINKQIAEHQGLLSDETLASWKEQSLSELNDWHSSAVAEVRAAIQKERNAADAKYQAYLAEVEKLEAEYMQKATQELKQDAARLITLYKKNKNVKKELLQTAPSLLMVSKDIFSPSAKTVLLNLAKESLKDDSECTAKYSPSCDMQVNALSVLGILGTPDSEGELISDFIIKHFTTQAVVPVLITGMGALIVMGDVNHIHRVLYEADQKEKDLRDIDVLSLATYAELFAVIRGQYLGNISKFAEYTMPNGKATNAWTDVGMMMAKSENPEIMASLNKFTISKCFASSSPDLKLETEYKVSCHGIEPLLAGQLLSGEQIQFEGYALSPYNIVGEYTPVEVLSGDQFRSDGSVYTIRPEQTALMKNDLKYYRAKFKVCANKVGLSRQEFLAIELMNAGMGDISAESERDLDKALLASYPNLAARAGEYAVVTDNAFKAKQARQIRTKRWITALSIADIAIMVWCFWDLSKWVFKGLRGIGRIGMRISHSFKLARTGSQAARLAYLRENLSFFQQVRARSNARLASLIKIKNRIQNAAEPIVLAQRSLYTSAPLPLYEMPKVATAVENTLANTKFVAQTATFATDAKAAYEASAGMPNRVLDIQRTKQALQTAAAQANDVYFKKGFLGKFRSYNAYLAKEVKTVFSAPEFTHKEYLNALDFNATLAKGVAGRFVVEERQSQGIKLVSTQAMPETAGVKTMELYLDTGDKQTAFGMPVQVSFGETKLPWHKRLFNWKDATAPSKIPGVKFEELSSVLFTKNASKEDWLTFVSNGERKLSFTDRITAKIADMAGFKWEPKVPNFIDPDFFKMSISDASLPQLIRTAQQSNTPLELKYVGELTGSSKYSFAVKDFFKGKTSLYSGRGNVLIREGGVLKETPVALNTTYHFNGMKLIIEDNNALTILGADGKLLQNPYSFTLPKHQIGNFSKVAIDYGNYSNPLQLALTGAKSKMNPLFFVTALSLSAASAGLIGPFEKSFGANLSPIEKFGITVALPYSGSLLSPLIAPFVKRYGAINVLKASSVIALGSLILPTVFGFNGFGDINIYRNGTDNPNPSIMPLLVSAGAIGISAALTRSAFNPLMQSIGGSSNLLKSMAFKNASSFLMVLPPLTYNILDAIDPVYRTNEDGSFLMKANKKTGEMEKVTKSRVDFSFSYPTLAAIVGGSLFWLQKARISTNIGKVANYSLKANLTHESYAATKFIVQKGTAPIFWGATAVLGAEASLFNAYSMKEANKYMGDYVGFEPLVPVAAVAATATIPFLVRYKSKPLLKALGGEEKLSTYQKMLVGSFAVAGTGGLILNAQNDDFAFWSGMALVSIGFANTTNSFLKIGTFNLRARETAAFIPMLKAAGVSEEYISSYKALGLNKTVDAMRKAGTSENAIGALLTADKTIKPMITNFEVVYPGVHIGMAVVPYAFSTLSKYREEHYGESQGVALQKSLYLPLASLGIASGLGIYGMGSNLSFKLPGNIFAKAPTGLLGGARLLIGKPSIENMMNNVHNGFNIGPAKTMFQQTQQPKIDLLKGFSTQGEETNFLKTDLKLKPLMLNSINTEEAEVENSEPQTTEPETIQPQTTEAQLLAEPVF